MVSLLHQLRQAFFDHDLAAKNARWSVLQGGRTNQVWHVEGKRQELVCKLFRATDNNPLYPNSPGVEYEALKLLYQFDISPKPVALLNTVAGEVLVYEHISGQSWQSDTQSVAKKLSQLHKLGFDLPLRQIATGSDAIMRQTDAILDLCKTRPEALSVASVVPAVSAMGIGHLIHADVVPNNIIVTSSGLRLIDWQCPALGDPCEDISSFLSPAMQYLYRGAPLSDRDIDEFLASYPCSETVSRYKRLASFFHRRIAAYCQWKTEQGEADYASALELELASLNSANRNNNETC